ncbi:MAG TPA: hypothetical protein VLH16_05065 [Bacteroidales bacterium]|nr:hypothetical protein [Bacteroidales bacterium]
MKNITNYLIILLVLVSITGCQKNEDQVPFVSENVETETEPNGKIVLGKKLENPYSIKNMKRAYKSLMEKEGIKSLTFDSTIITVTDLYVRFLPQNATELDALLEDHTLELFDFPLDYEILEEGVYYHDPMIPVNEITWLYTSVKVDYDFPDVEKEILEECFIPDVETKTGDPELYDFLRKLEIEAFRITGNLGDDFQWIESKAKPSGNIQVINTQNNQPLGVRKVKVRVHNFVKWNTAFTNLDGYYQMTKNFLTNVHYAVIFENETGFRIWGNLAFLLPATYNMGWNSSSGKNKTFHTNSVAWLWSTVNNASHIYREVLCPQFGVTKPPASLRLWTFRMGGGNLGSAPMARQISMSPANLILLLGIYNITGFHSWIVLCLPDIFILKNFTNTKEAYETVFHELAHASHYTKAGNSYWLNYITGIIGNGSNNPYGNGTGSKDGFIGVGEMWGYYFEYAAMKQHFGSAPLKGVDWWFKPQIIQRLIDVDGFTQQQIFNCLTTDVNNHNKLKNKIISNYGQATSVNYTFSLWGF